MPNKKISVLFASAELAPLAKVGGLADVAGALPPELKKLGVDIRIIIPKYGSIDEKKYRLKKIVSGVAVKFQKSSHKINLYQAVLPGSSTIVYLIENKHFLGHGGVYLTADASSRGTKCEFERFGFFSLAVLDIIKNFSWQPRIIHCNDWHVGLIPRLIKSRNLKLKSLTTIHNLAYQGWYIKEFVAQALGLNLNLFQPVKKCIVSLREAILASDLLNTVSPNYAKEILTKEFGCGLEGDLVKRKNYLSGILNGIDTKIFNPATDKYIRSKFTAETITKKLANKIYLQKICGLPQGENLPLFGMVGRLTAQKGIDLVMEIFEKLMGLDLQLVILATGDKKYEKSLKALAERYPDKFSFHPKFDLKLAQRIYAGADAFLMPSLFEPCGLGQMIAMRYGTIPIVRSVGGLRDTVKNYTTNNLRTEATGFSFKNYNPQSLYKTIAKATSLYCQQPKVWRQLQTTCLSQDFSWQSSAKKYLKLYQRLLK